MIRPVVVLVVIAGAIVLQAPRALADTAFFASPNGSGDCTTQSTACSLTTALAAATAGDTVNLAGGTYDVEAVNLVDGASVVAEVGTAPVLDAHGRSGIFDTSADAVTITGLTLEGSAGASAIDNGAAKLTLTDDTFIGNNASNNGVTGHGDGAALEDDGDSITVVGSTFTDNVADTAGTFGSGGAIAVADGSLTIDDSTFDDNTATVSPTPHGEGGAIAATTETLTISASTFSGNIAASTQVATTNNVIDAGGAIEVDGGSEGSETPSTVEITGSTFDHNEASTASTGHAAGGALEIDDSPATIVNSTIADNTADPTTPTGSFIGFGGGVDGLDSTIVIAESTLYGNTNGATSGVGTAVDADNATLADDLIARNAGKTLACAGTITDGGYDLTDDSSCPVTTSTSELSNDLDDSTSPLASNGSPRQTVAITPTSPAAGVVPASFTLPTSAAPTACSLNDERDVLRPAEGCDVGAYEVSPVMTASIKGGAPVSKAGWFHTPVTVSFSCAKTDSSLACAPPQKLSSSGKNQKVTGMATAKDGGTATATVTGIDIDLTKPKASVDGTIKPHKVYSNKPKLTCSATDTYSGVGSCTLSTTKKKGTATVTATATDLAGNVGTATRTYLYK